MLIVPEYSSILWYVPSALISCSLEKTLGISLFSQNDYCDSSIMLKTILPIEIEPNSQFWHWCLDILSEDIHINRWCHTKRCRGCLDDLGIKKLLLIDNCHFCDNSSVEEKLWLIVKCHPNPVIRFFQYSP